MCIHDSQKLRVGCTSVAACIHNLHQRRVHISRHGEALWSAIWHGIRPEPNLRRWQNCVTQWERWRWYWCLSYSSRYSVASPTPTPTAPKSALESTSAPPPCYKTSPPSWIGFCYNHHVITDGWLAIPNGNNFPRKTFSWYFNLSIALNWARKCIQLLLLSTILCVDWINYYWFGENNARRCNNVRLKLCCYNIIGWKFLGKLLD